MKSTVGIFESRSDAQHAVEQMRSIGIARDRIDLLTPQVTEKQVRAVPTTETEQSGMGAVLGGVVGGAIGAAGGLSLGAAAASLFVPGVGPIIATGLIGAALFGTGGAIGGAAAGAALEDDMAKGLPKDELYLYEDALRQGHSVVIAIAEDEEQAVAARKIMEQAGAESLDAAREDWWLGLRDVENEHYSEQGGDFATDEPHYRRGFEASLHPERRELPYDEAVGYLVECYGDECREKAFRIGYDRGQAYNRQLKEKHDQKTK